MEAKETTQLLSRYRTVAVLTAVLGPVLVLLAIANVVMVRLLYWLLELHGSERLPLGALSGAALAFGEVSGLVTAPIGVVLAWAGIRALRRPPALGRRALLAAAWLTVVAMVLLTGLWELEAFQYHMPMAFHALGISMHGLQVIAVLQAVRFLNGPPLKQAVEAEGGA